VYCDFAIAVRADVPGEAFARALKREHDLRGAETFRANADTVYFGGGTPSLLDADRLARAIELFAPAPQAEVTIEVNPDDVTREAAAAWTAAGVTRVSVGVQSFEDSVLEWMHRTHDGRAAMAAVETVRDLVANVSVDLIFGLPADLEHDFEADLGRAISFETDHLSLYGLTVESGTPLGKWVARGTTTLPSNSSYGEAFLRAHDVLTARGYEHYEISNYATPGNRSRHNSSYWSGRSYVGLGPSAHSFDAGRGLRRWNVRDWKEYERQLAGSNEPIGGTETLLENQRRLETLYLGLRTSDGVSRADIGESAFLGHLLDNRLAVEQGDRIVLTPSGWLKSDEITVGLTTSAEGG
jgi:oxygen-independent coproporphyrinogen-3 oxidase